MAILLRSTAEKYESRGSIASVRVSYIEIVDAGSRSFRSAYRCPRAPFFRFDQLRVCVSATSCAVRVSTFFQNSISPDAFQLSENPSELRTRDFRLSSSNVRYLLSNFIGVDETTTLCDRTTVRKFAQLRY